VVDACGNVPVVIAGGKKLPEKEALQMRPQCCFGWRCRVDMEGHIPEDSPVGMIQAVKAIVHEGSAG